MKSITSTIAACALTGIATFAATSTLNERVERLEKALTSQHTVNKHTLNAMLLLNDQVFVTWAIIGGEHPRVMSGLKAKNKHFREYLDKNDLR